MDLLYSTFIYLSFFVPSLILFYLAEKIFKQADGFQYMRDSRLVTKSIGWIVSLFAIALPCILAALRDDSVGADTAGYGVLGFKYIQSHNSLKSVLLSYDDKFFYMICYIITRFTTNVAWWLGIIQVLTIVPVFYVAYKRRQYVSLWIVMAVYIFKFYNYSLCIMRQSIACSFILLGLYFWEEKKYIKLVLCMFIACNIHTTAILAIVLFALAIIFTNGNKKAKYYKVVRNIGILSLGVVLFLPQLANLILVYGILPEKYSYFLRFFGDYEFSRFGLFEVGWRLLLLVFLYILYKKCDSSIERNWLLYSIMGCFSYIVVEIFLGISVFYRITEYVDFFFMFAIAILANRITINKSKVLGRSIIIILLFVYWLMAYIIFANGYMFETEIYKFR